MDKRPSGWEPRSWFASLDRRQAAAAAYQHLASPAKDTLNGPKTKSAQTRNAEGTPGVCGRILACLGFIFIPVGIQSGKIAAGQESAQVKPADWHTTPQQFVREDRLLSVKWESRSDVKSREVADMLISAKSLSSGNSGGAVKMFILKTCRVTRWRPVLKWHEEDVAEI